MCVFEEASRRDLKIKPPRMFSIQKQGMDYCQQCKLSAHNTVSNASISKVEGFKNLNFFEMMHLQLKKYLWYKYDDNGVGR